MALIEDTAFDPLGGRDFRDLADRIESERQWLAGRRCVNTVLADGGIARGAVFRSPCADGYAYLIVTRDNPLTVVAVRIGDAFELSETQVAAIGRDDVLAMAGMM